MPILGQRGALVAVKPGHALCFGPTFSGAARVQRAVLRRLTSFQRIYPIFTSKIRLVIDES
jgi:hypothetical protein